MSKQLYANDISKRIVRSQRLMREARIQRAQVRRRLKALGPASRCDACQGDGWRRCSRGCCTEECSVCGGSGRDEAGDSMRKDILMSSLTYHEERLARLGRGLRVWREVRSGIYAEEEDEGDDAN